MSEREGEGRPAEPEVATTVEEEQQALVEPVGEAAGRAVGAVSESAGEATRDAFVEGEKETTPLIAFTGVSIVVGVLVTLVLALAFLVYFLAG